VSLNFTDVSKGSAVLETSVNTNPATRRHIPEDPYHHSNLCECLKSRCLTIRSVTGS